MTDQEPVVLSGRYELHRRIARGGMAEVCLARDQLLERPVAVKILVPEFASDRNFVERFRREAQAAANLNHPNIVGVYDWGKEAGTHFIVMEYVDGRSLADILRTEGTLHPDRAADIATDVAAALGFAHRNGVVHRDIKPGNVLISSQNIVKVTDFGIARAISRGAEENLTQTGSVMGTATYFSPEQAQGKPVDPRSDLYSLGVVMYEMVCGRPPFSGDSPVAIAYKHVQEQPTPLRHRNVDVPPAYEAVTLKLLAKNPANRYASAEDLRSDLRRFRQRVPVLAEGVLEPPVPAATRAAPATPLTEAIATSGGGPDYTSVANRGPEDRGRSGRHTGWFVALALLLVALLGGGIYLLARSLGVGGSDQVTVPDVSNQPVAAAAATLRNQGFNVRSDYQYEYSNSVAANSVIDTQPSAGSKVDKGSGITLIVSAGKTVTVPGNAKGRKAQAVSADLQDQGMDQSNIKLKFRKSDTVDAGDVLDTDPSPGSEVPPHGNVTLFVSSGTNRQVPDVTGQDQATATQALQQAGYQVGSTTQQYSNSIGAGKVISTDPPAGTHAKRDTVINLVVSLGPQPTTTTAPTTTAPSTTAPSTTAPSSSTSSTAPPTT